MVFRVLSVSQCLNADRVCGGAVACLVPLRHHSAGRIEPSFAGAHGHVMQPIIKSLFNNRFSQFLLQKIQQNKQAIIILKKINIMFNQTIWIVTLFS